MRPRNIEKDLQRVRDHALQVTNTTIQHQDEINLLYDVTAPVFFMFSDT